MQPGSAVMFSVPTEQAVDCARSLAARMGRHLHCKFSVQRQDVSTILIKRT